MDNQEKPLKEAFFPISPPNARGYFDIILRRVSESSSSSDKFAKTLDTMALGDELAFKAGKYRLNYSGEDSPIDGMTMIACGLGITPALQMLRGILPGKESTVEDVELVWVNEDKADFLCVKDIENMEFRYMDKLALTYVLQTDLYGKDITENERVSNAMSPYEYGRIAVVCGPDYIVTRVRDYFQDLGYPPENMLSVVIS
jgi:ferredoxin-NADP reductase